MPRCWRRSARCPAFQVDGTVLAGRVPRGAALDQHVAGTLRGRAARVRARAPARPRPLQLGLRVAGRARAARGAARRDAHNRLGRRSGARASRRPSRSTTLPLPRTTRRTSRATCPRSRRPSIRRARTSTRTRPRPTSARRRCGSYYEENKARYTQAGRRHARHILFAAGSDDAAAEANAKRAYERADAGEDFAALARELSEDPGSKESGGDLGEAEREDFVGPFGDAVWSMQPGEIRGPVKTEFGWHVIKLESASPEVTRSFEEVRAELEPEFRRVAGRKGLRRRPGRTRHARFRGPGRHRTPWRRG